MLRVGVITSTHGVRGEVKVFPTTDDAKRFKKLKTVILDTGKEYPIRIAQSIIPLCSCQSLVVWILFDFDKIKAPRTICVKFFF